MDGFLIGDDDDVVIRFKLKSDDEEKEKRMSYSDLKEFKQNNNLEYFKIIKVESSN